MKRLTRNLGLFHKDCTCVTYSLSIISITHPLLSCFHAVFSKCTSFFDTAVSYTRKMLMQSTPGACTLKHYGFVIYVYGSKLVCLSKLVCFSKPMKVSDNKKALANLSFSRKLRIRNFLLYRPFISLMINTPTQLTVKSKQSSWR